MKAIRFEQYGGPEVLQFVEVEKPQVQEGDILIEVKASSVQPFEWHHMRGEPRVMRLMTGMSRPKEPVLGADVAGIVAQVGEGVTEFAVGDEVFGNAKGALAEYAIGWETSLARKPKNVGFEQAGGVGIAACTALQALRDWGQLREGQSVLINGASGGVGTFAVQLAKVLGADVTAVCSGRNVELVRGLGADRVIDYERDDFTSGEERYDVFLDAIGNKPVNESRRVLKRKGIYVGLGGPSGKWFKPADRSLRVALLSPFVSQKLTQRLAKWNKEDLVYLAKLMEDGRIRTAVDLMYPLAEAAEAVRYVEQGHARGKVVITVE